MSGTSADGVDVALVAITGRGLAMTARLLHHHARPYTPALKDAIFAARSGGSIALSDLAQLARGISLAYAAAVNAALAESSLQARDIAAIAAHGQTLFHAPPNTIQWLDPALLAAEVGCPVISDFRRADCAAGGQGAPLVPFADYVLFRHAEANRVLLNLGGIANVTLLPASCTLDQVIAFDTGPGNCVMDHLMRQADPAGEGIDRGGERASRGRIIEPLLQRLMETPYLHRPPPKSTDGPEMIRAWTGAAADYPATSLEDRLATACEWTARSVLHALLIHSAFPHSIPFADGGGKVIATGGGTHNQTLMRSLDMHGTPFSVSASDTFGIPSAAKEAVAFALLGAATLDGEPSNVPSATGARRRVVLGSITPAP